MAATVRSIALEGIEGFTLEILKSSNRSASTV